MKMIIDYLLSSDPELSELGKALILDKLDLDEFYNSFNHHYTSDPLSFFEAWIKFITCKVCTFEDCRIVWCTYQREAPFLSCDYTYFLTILEICLSKNND